MEKVIVITGASSGIGLTTGRLLKNNGYKVVNISKENCEEFETFVGDVSNYLALEEFFNKIGEKYKEIFALINCAGFGISGAVELTQEALAQKIMDVNFLGTFYAAKYALKYMKKGAKIINISSACALYPVPFRTFYCASKAAVQMLSYGLKMELKNAGIDVCAVCPGEVQTNFSKNREKDFSTNEKYGDAVKNAALHIEHNEKKRMSPQVVANRIFKLINKKRMKPFVIVSGKYKILNFFTRFVPQSLILKGSNKILGGKKYKNY